MLKTQFINSPNAEYTDKEISWFQDIVLQSGYFADNSGNRKFAVVQKTVPSMAVDITSGNVLLDFAQAGKHGRSLQKILQLIQRLLRRTFQVLIALMRSL